MTRIHKQKYIFFSNNLKEILVIYIALTVTDGNFSHLLLKCKIAMLRDKPSQAKVKLGLPVHLLCCENERNQGDRQMVEKYGRYGKQLLLFFAFNSYKKDKVNIQRENKNPVGVGERRGGGRGKKSRNTYLTLETCQAVFNRCRLT